MTFTLIKNFNRLKSITIILGQEKSLDAGMSLTVAAKQSQSKYPWAQNKAMGCLPLC